jgi:hypothetical protein
MSQNLDAIRAAEGMRDRTRPWTRQQRGGFDGRPARSMSHIATIDFQYFRAT